MTPGDYIKSEYLTANNISGNELADHLGVEGSTISRLLEGHIEISPRMAIRLAYVLGKSPEYWLTFTFNRQLEKAWEEKTLIEAECMPLFEG